MVSADDILFTIARGFHDYSGADREAAIEEFLQGHVFDLHLAVTGNLQAAEVEFAQRYGEGHRFHFPLKNAAHGRLLSEELRWIMLGMKPDGNAGGSEPVESSDPLFLLVLVRENEAGK